eukprot:TRINITY_DN13445_c0_g1_i3.p2 TRINITY_DN13445_c0_g1~~TRINITY_DN13445_c0_g1_i3.p2  ORF type:complete len:186 (+),score=46.36 TRINITY_DN13445_c0_g1_i3:73-630(+)
MCIRDRKINASSAIIEKYKDELAALENVYAFAHTNIVKYEKTLVNEGSNEYAIVMEYCSSKLVRQSIGKSLDEIIEGCKKKNKHLPEDKLLRMLIEILLGLDYIHGCKIFHGNLKPSNVLITHQGRIKISDFGLSTALRSTKHRSNFPYMSPETLRGEESETADIWSLGCIAYKLCCLQVTFGRA